MQTTRLIDLCLICLGSHLTLWIVMWVQEGSVCLPADSSPSMQCACAHKVGAQPQRQQADRQQLAHSDCICSQSALCIQEHYIFALAMMKQLLHGDAQLFNCSPAVSLHQGTFHLVYAGLPTLQAHPIMCMDPRSGSIALSPDRKALAVFRGDEERSLSSLLSGPARIDLSMGHTMQRLTSYCDLDERPSITAMAFSGKASSWSGVTSLRLVLASAL